MSSVVPELRVGAAVGAPRTTMLSSDVTFQRGHSKLAMAPPAVPAELLPKEEYPLNTIDVSAFTIKPPPISVARLPDTITVVKINSLAVSEAKPPPDSASLSANSEEENLALLSELKAIPPPKVVAMLLSARHPVHAIWLSLLA